MHSDGALLRRRLLGRNGQLELLRDLDAVQLRGVEPEDLLLAVDAEARKVRELGVIGHLPVHEALDLPLRLPDRVVGAEQHLVLADPEQQLAHDLREELRARVHQAADDHGEAGVDVGLLRRHEAEVLDPRQADVLDDEVEPAVVVGGHVVDVGDVERVLVQRPDRRALVDVDVLDAELRALVEERLGRLVGQLPAARALVPLGRVELDALDAVLLVVGLELLEPRRALARVEAAVEDQTVAEALLGHRVLLDGVEALRVPLLQVRRLEDRHVDVALGEDVLLEVVERVLLEVLQRPVRLRRAEALVGVEALDPALRVLLGARLPVLGARVPEVEMAVEDEVLLAVLLVHMGSSYWTGCRSNPMYSAASSGLANSSTRSSSTTIRP